MAGMISMHLEQFLEDAFLRILNMSMTASYIIAAVIIARLLLKKAPKKYSYALWAAAVFRLVCPVSFKSVFSLLALKPLAMPVEEMASGAGTQIVHIQPDIGLMAQPEIHTGLPAVNAVVNPTLPAPTTELASVNPMQIWTILGAYAWALGIVVLLLLSAVSLAKLHRSLRTATVLEGNVWQSENVRSPFIVGLFRPKIYIPYGLTEPGLGYVLAHERAHIKRLDHVVRTLGYLVLCLHWFNPLVWLAFYLMGRDMELSCDEKVLSGMADKAEYSETLLSFAAPRRFPTPTPLAFGESGVSQRIKNALKWRKPKVWVSLVALVCCLAVLLACAANPREEDADELWGDWVPVAYDYLSPLSSTMFMNGDNGNLYRMSESGGVTVRSHFNPAENVREIYEVGWGWQDFPYTDEEWEEMITLYSSNFPMPISEMYDEILYQPLIDKKFYAVSWTDAPSTEIFLLRLDGELKMVYSTVDKDGAQSVYSIITLERVENLGTATFRYEPEKTSNEPGIEIRFPEGCEVAYSCYNGSIAAYNAVGERFTEGENVDSGGICSGNIPVGGKLFWSPVKETDKGIIVAEYDTISIYIWTGFNTFTGDIYIDSENGTYTLTTAGSDTRLRQNADGSVSVVFSDEAKYAMENMVKTPEELPNEKCPYDWTSTLTAGEIRELSSSFGIDGATLTSPKFIEALADALRSARKSDFTKETSMMQAVDCILDIHCGEGVYTLLYNDGVVEFAFSESLVASRYPELSPGTWRLRCDELSALLESVYYREELPASATDLDPASPWELLAGLEREKISGIMIDGDPAAVGNAKDPMAVADAVVAALNKVGYAEIYAGRGMPNRYAIGINYDNDASSFTLGYCGDFVELRLQGEAAEKYPVSGGPVWEIHNEALTELLSSLIRPALTSFEAYISQDEAVGFTARFDLGGYDSVEVLDYFRCFPDETGASSGGSATGNPLAETWWPDEMLTERGRALAESGGILITVRKGGGYAQGQLVFEGTATEKDAGGLVRGAEYKVYLEGPFNYALSEDGTEVTLSLDEDWLKPTPAYMLSQLKLSDMTGFELSGQLDGRIINAGIRDREIVEALAELEPGELEIVQNSAFFTEECRAVLQTKAGTIILSYGNGETRFSFEGDYSGFSEIVGTWSTKNEALCGIFYEISVSKENGLSYAYHVGDNPSLRFDFGEYECLELSYEGGNMLYSADGEGWGDFFGSRFFREGEEIRWTPMEPVDDENVLARRVDSAWIVASVTREGVTYGGTIYIEGKDGVYTVGTGESRWPKLQQGEDGCVEVAFD